ncbi:MAG: hypothetical protein AAF959_01460 [Cyanobacteria bacterium P01_D01_bin.56]
MARAKRNSSILEKAERRLESLISIDPELDMGNGRTVAAFSTVINDLSNKLANYNTTLSVVDRMADEVKVAEQAAKAMSEQMLLGIASCYGKNSQEYEMAGGTRRRSRNSSKSKSTVEPKSSEPVPSSANRESSMNGSQNGSQPFSITT